MRRDHDLDTNLIPAEYSAFSGQPLTLLLSTRFGGDATDARGLRLLTKMDLYGRLCSMATGWRRITKPQGHHVPSMCGSELGMIDSLRLAIIAPRAKPVRYVGA